MADPLDGKDLDENRGCVMKSLRFMVNNYLSILIVSEYLPQKPLPLPPDSPLVKEDLTEKVWLISLVIRLS